jgi:hypothetical protein
MSGLSRFVSGFKAGKREHREQRLRSNPEPQIPGWLAFTAISTILLVFGGFAFWMEFGNPGASGTTGSFLMPLAILFIALPSSVAAYYKFRTLKRQRKNGGRARI